WLRPAGDRVRRLMICEKPTGGVCDPAGMAAPDDASLRSLVSLPDVARTLASSLLGGLPYTAIALLLILRVRDAGGDYGDGGIVAGAFSVGLAALSPLVGRLVDLRGHRAVLLPAAVVSSVPLVVIAIAPDSTPVAAF